jgi:hypothetical protein
VTALTLPETSRSLQSEVLIAEIEALLATEIFSGPESHGPLFRAAFAWLVLNVHDRLQDLDRGGLRVSQVDGSDDDVTALISRARYAIVHAGAGGKRAVRGRASTSRFVILVGDASGHSDDIAIETGGVRVLIRRHLVRGFEAARDTVRAMPLPE